MRKSLATIILIVITLASCQKEISGDFLDKPTPNDLLGTWRFLNSHVSTNSTVEVNDGSADVKNITVSNYTSVNNQGSLLFDDSMMITSGVAYDISTIAKSYTYVDGSIEDSTDFPFSYSFPATNSSSAYKRIGTDSVYVAGNSLTEVTSPTGSQSPPGGYRYKIISDTLVLTAMINQTSIDNTLGFPVITTDKASIIATLKKQ